MNVLGLLDKLGRKNWVDVTTQYLLSGKYLNNNFIFRDTMGNITLPKYVPFTMSEDREDTLWQWNYDTETNLKYMKTLGADRDHLVKYREEVSKKENENSNVDAFKEANTRIAEYETFIKKHLGNHMFKVGNRFNLQFADNSWGEKNEALNERIKAIKKSKKKSWKKIEEI